MEGKNRMSSYISHAFVQTSIKSKKLRWRKLLTFTPKKATARTQNSKLSQVTLLLERTYAQLKKSGFYLEKNIEFPLALCNEFGEMRDITNKA